MAEPPLETGAENVTVACALPAVAVPIVGAPGTVRGMTLFDAPEGGLTPARLVAVTVNVYAVALASPFTVIVVHGAVQVPVRFEGDDVAV